MTPAVILAGGKATRMGGGDKSLLPLGDGTILSHVIERLEPQAGPIALNANGDPSRFDDFGIPVIGDPMPGQPGPLGGVLAGLHWGRAANASHIVTVAADTPFFPSNYVAALEAEERATRARVVFAKTSDGRHPTFGLWSTDLIESLADAVASGVRKVVAFADEAGSSSHEFARREFDPFFNVNTPQDLQEAQRLLERVAR